MPLDITAILWGVFTGLVVGLMAGVIVAAAWGVDLSRRFGDDDDISDEVFAWQWAEAVSEVPFTVGLLVITLLVAVLAGYVTAWLATRAPYLNAAATGGIGMLISHFMERDDPVLPRHYLFLAQTAMIPAHLAGAWIAVG